MSFFELYGLPVSLILDKSKVSEKFYELSRECHPDHFTRQSPREQREMLEKSSMVNNAFKIFQNPDETIKYVLKLKDLLHDDEKYELDPEFLMQVMEISEKLKELQADTHEQPLEEVELKAKQLLNQIHNDVAPILENYQDDSATEKELLQVKDYYYRKKYLQRILDKIYEIRNIASHI